MCGIMGYVGSQTAAPILLQGLRRLEYRGYDSAGIATLRNGSIDRRRAGGKLDNLVASLEAAPLTGTIGIGHTRWATHGRPTLTNAHPHANDRVAVVHNGIIENFRELREELVTKGHCFETETDSEVIAHLICDFLNYQKTPEEALKATLASLEGAFAIAVIFAGHHHLLLGARRGSPLAVGHSEGEMFIGSDALALAPFTARVSYLEEGDWVAVTPQGARFYDAAGQAVERPATQSAASTLLVGKGPYRHFMEKEIFEQPSVVSYTLNSLLDPLAGRVVLPDLGLDWTQVSRLTLVACGTAHYAGHVAKYWFEQLARLPVEIDIASEFRYRDSPLPEGGVALFISQSGETIDTLEALRHAKAAGQRIISLVNMPESAIARESDAVLQTLAGPEIGVASTKAFTTQLTVLACLALAAARARAQMTPPAERQGRTLRLTDLAKANGLKVFVMDFGDDPKTVEESHRRNKEKGYVSITAHAPAAELNSLPPYPRRPYDENAKSIVSLKDVLNFAVISDSSSFGRIDEFALKMHRTNYDLLIVDVFHGRAPLSRQAVETLKYKMLGAKRLVFATVNVGSAASYRYYWKPTWGEGSPPWIGAPLRDDPDSYNVKFWRPEWQRIISGDTNSYIYGAIAQGFDGVVLEGIEEAYRFFEGGGEEQEEEEEAPAPTPTAEAAPAEAPPAEAPPAAAGTPPAAQ